jgi:hypothetical protein
MLALDHLRYADQSGRLRHFVAWDLRPHLEPPMGPRLGACIAAGLLTTRVSGRGLWELAREMSEGVRRSGRLGEPFVSAWLSPSLMRAYMTLGRRLADTALSYSRLDAPIHCAGPIEVLGVDTFISSTPIGPEFSLFARWLSGELWLNAAYLDSDMQPPEAEALIEEVVGTLAAP